MKEGLVEKSKQWPGPSGLPQTLDPTHELVGLWYDRTTAYRMRKAGIEVKPEDWISEERVVLSPFPALQHLSVSQRRDLIEGLMREIEAEVQAIHLRPAAGVAAILAQDAVAMGRKLKRSPIPLVHAASLAAWRAFKDAYRVFVAAYQHASARLGAGVRDVVFPIGCFPPPMPFVSCAPT